MTPNGIKIALRLSFILTLVYLPLAFGANRPMFWSPAFIAIQLICSVAVCLELWIGANAARNRSPVTFPAIVLGAYLTLQAILYLAGVHHADLHAIRVGIMKTFVLLQIFLLVPYLFNSRRGLRVLLSSIVACGFFQSIYGIAMTTSGVEHIWNQPKTAYIGYATGTFINRNHLAGYLELCIPVAIGLLLSTNQSIVASQWRQFAKAIIDNIFSVRFVLLIVITVMFMATFMTQSRMGTLSLFTGLLVGIAIRVSLERAKVAISGFSLLGLTFAAAIVVSFSNVTSLLTRYSVASILEDERLPLYSATLDLIRHHTWFGSGLGSWYVRFTTVEPPGLQHRFLQAHNDYLQFASETGLIGMILLAAFVLSTITRAIWLQINSNSRLIRLISFGASSGIYAILTHSLTDFNLQVFANAATFTVLCAVVWTADDSLKNREAARTH